MSSSAAYPASNPASGSAYAARVILTPGPDTAPAGAASARNLPTSAGDWSAVRASTALSVLISESLMIVVHSQLTTDWRTGSTLTNSRTLSRKKVSGCCTVRNSCSLRGRGERTRSCTERSKLGRGNSKAGLGSTSSPLAGRGHIADAWNSADPKMMLRKVERALPLRF
eukprot:scaffold286661_cov26-Tisochrysis_lutea.AAC.9